MTCTHCGAPAIQQLEGTTGNHRSVTDYRCELHATMESQLGGPAYTGSGTRYTLARILSVGATPAQMSLQADAGVSREAVIDGAPAQRAGRFTPLLPNGVHVWDETQRIYLLRRRTTENWHLIRALPADDADVQAGTRVKGTLVCCCPGWQFHRMCWALEVVRRHELATDTRWDPPAAEPTLEVASA